MDAAISNETGTDRRGAKTLLRVVGRAVLLVAVAAAVLPATTGSLKSDAEHGALGSEAALQIRFDASPIIPVTASSLMRSAALPPIVLASLETGKAKRIARQVIVLPASAVSGRSARVLAKPTRSSILRVGLASGDAEMRTALPAPQSTAGRIAAAMNFTARHPEIRIAMDEPPVQAPDKSVAGVRTASLQPAVEAGLVGKALQDLAENKTLAAALAYAPASTGRPSAAALFDMILGRDDRFVPPLGGADHSWAATPLPASAYSDDEQRCLATGIYFEARGESEAGQAAVAQVMLNRVRSPAFPDTICGVVYQNKNRHNRCQFSFACDGAKDVILNQTAYAKAQRVALSVTKGEIWNPEVGSATHYHARYVKPRWAKAMQEVDSIGLHVFYRTFGGGWN